MSIFDRLFGKLATQKAEAEAQRAATLDDAHAAIVRGALGKSEKTDEAVLQSAIESGLITEEQVKLLVDRAIVLKNYLADGETKYEPADYDQCQATIAAANEAIKAAQRKVRDAEAVHAMVQSARSSAQSVMLQYPEIGEQLAKAMGVSWNPRCCPVTGRKLNDSPRLTNDDVGHDHNDGHSSSHSSSPSVGPSSSKAESNDGATLANKYAKTNG